MAFSNEELEMCIEGLKSDDPDIRRESAEDLGYSEREEAAGILLLYLTDEDRGVRDAVAESLKRTANEKEAYKIIDFLRSEIIDIRNFAVDILIHLESKSVPALIDNMHDNDHDVRKFIVDILGIIKEESCLEEMHKLLDDSDQNVQISVVEALGNIGSASSINPLIRASEKNPTFKATAIEALGKIGDDQVIEFILKSCDDEDPLISFTAIETLGKIGRKEQLLPLFKMIERKEEFHISPLFMAIMQIAEKFEDSFFDYIKEYQEIAEKYISIALTDNEVVNRLSANILEYGNKNNLDFILKYLKFITKDAKLSTIELIKENYDKAYLPLIEFLLKDHDQWVVFKTCDLISEFKIEEMVNPVLDLLNNENPMLQIAAIKALDGLKAENSIRKVEELLKNSSNDDIQKEAQRFLNDIKNDSE